MFGNSFFFNSKLFRWSFNIAKNRGRIYYLNSHPHPSSLVSSSGALGSSYEFSLPVCHSNSINFFSGASANIVRFIFQNSLTPLTAGLMLALHLADQLHRAQ